MKRSCFDMNNLNWEVFVTPGIPDIRAGAAM
jgi:hypothetical protein